MKIHIYNSNLEEASYPDNWDTLCAANKININTDSDTKVVVSDTSITLDVTSSAEDRYNKFIANKQKSIRSGGSYSCSTDIGEYAHDFSNTDVITKWLSYCYGEGNTTYLSTINSIPPTDSGSFCIVGGHAVGLRPVTGGIEVGVLKQHSESESSKEVLCDSNAAAWVLYHNFNELVCRYLMTDYSKGYLGLLHQYYAACLRWNYYVYDKLNRASVVNSNSVLTITWGYTCAHCTEEARAVVITFKTKPTLEKTTLKTRFDSAAKLLAMSGEYVPYVSPISTNNVAINPTISIEKTVLVSMTGAETTTVSSTGYGDDKIYEQVAGYRVYEAYNNWTDITITINIPELRQGDRVAYVIQLLRGGRSMSGRVLSTKEDVGGLQEFDVDVKLIDPYVDTTPIVDKDGPQLDIGVIAKPYVAIDKTERLLGYVTITEDDSENSNGVLV